MLFFTVNFEDLFNISPLYRSTVSSMAVLHKLGVLLNCHFNGLRAAPYIPL